NDSGFRTSLECVRVKVTVLPEYFEIVTLKCDVDTQSTPRKIVMMTSVAFSGPKQTVTPNSITKGLLMEEARGDMFAPQKRSMMMSPVNPPVNGGMAYSSSKRGPTLWISRKDHASEGKEAAARDQRLMVDILEDLTGETQTNSVYSNKEWIVADWGSAEWLNIFGRVQRETQDRDKNAAKLDKRVSEMNKGLRLAARGTADPKKRQGCAWPETDNTWELLENLHLRPGKAVKKRKGQYGGCNSQLNKKKNQQGLASTSDDASEKTDPTLNELSVRRFMKEVLKSGIVKRYIPDETTSNNQITKAADQNGTPDLDIVRIIKAVFFTLEFKLLSTCFGFIPTYRSDGEEVTVDNKFLRAHKLIDFYEQHITYKPKS
ncbi:hypothetical protein HID58_067191, partial [Brassica napus]